MQIAEERVDGVVAVAPAGRIDTTTAPLLEAHLIALLTAGERRLVVDFSGVDYISSAGLRVLLLLARRVQQADGRLGLCAMGEAVRQVFQLAGFLPLFTVCDSREAAVQQIGGS
jgi:stage II sporulation protein AA (anti-sigma F factor antagonist)